MAEAKTGSLSLEKPIYIRRWNDHQRVQHLVLVLSMALLFITGFPIKFSNAPWAPFIMRLFGGFGNMLLAHKVGAVLLMLDGVYHLVYLLAYWRKYGPTWDMIPRVKDFKDAVQHGLYLVGLTEEGPKFDRYSYLEKFEYLAIFWGMPIMVVTGLALWFPGVAGSFLPRWVLDAFRIVHSNEALIALIALVFGHFFVVHFRPDVFPNNPVWLTGKIPLHLMAEEHPLELERMDLKKLGISPEEVHHLPGNKWSYNIPLIITEIMIYTAITAALLSVFVPLLLFK